MVVDALKKPLGVEDCGNNLLMAKIKEMGKPICS